MTVGGSVWVMWGGSCRRGCGMCDPQGGRPSGVWEKVCGGVGGLRSSLNGGLMGMGEPGVHGSSEQFLLPSQAGALQPWETSSVLGPLPQAPSRPPGSSPCPPTGSPPTPWPSPPKTWKSLKKHLPGPHKAPHWYVHRREWIGFSDRSAVMFGTNWEAKEVFPEGEDGGGAEGRTRLLLAHICRISKEER